jgi:hypothetical protein
MVKELCAVIRETGVSDSGAAARVSLHPSTVSRWKREVPDLAILLRSAREEFRMAHLGLIMAKAHAGEATSWRAAAWLLERTFPEDYSPRAKERALFQERFDALCAAEEQGGEIALPNRVDPLQNVKYSVVPLADRLEPGAPNGLQDVKNSPLPAAPELHHPEKALQNVKNPTLAGSQGIDAPETPLQNVKNAAPDAAPPGLERRG